MRSLKMILAAVFLTGSVVASVLVFWQSHGAGIATGVLLALVTFAFIYDNRASRKGLDAVEEDVAAGSMALQRNVALRQARAMTAHEDAGSGGGMMRPSRRYK